jgi:beta-phosphoglucomutase-like phosphatase (HAD superfamily)
VAVRRLADRWPLGLASSANRPVIDTVLKQAGITDCFAVTVSGEEVAAGKPAPDVYLAATHQLGVDRSTLLPWRTRRTACERPPRREWS